MSIKPISNHLPINVVDFVNDFYLREGNYSYEGNGVYTPNPKSRGENKLNGKPLANNREGKISEQSEDVFTHKNIEGDLYSKYPMRLLGFTNEIGAAVSPIVGPAAEMLSYIPSMTYILMDTADKYRRGENSDYKKESFKRGAEQLTFQVFASVLLPTSIVKTAQALTDKFIDLKIVKGLRGNFLNQLKKKPQADKFLKRFADSPIGKGHEGAFAKFALKFQKALNIITVVPLFFKDKGPKSGLRNFALVLVGITTLGFAIKPVDQFTEKVIIKKGFRGLFDKKDKSEKSS